MKILQLCTRVPNPPVDGGSIAMLNLEYALHQNGAELKVIAFNTIKQPVQFDTLDQEYLTMTHIEAVYLDNRIKLFEAFFNLFSGESYHIVRFIRRDFEELLVKTLSENTFDVIQLESLFMVPYLETIRRMSKAPIVLRTHNIEHLIWERMAKGCKNPFKKWYLNLLAKRLLQYEKWAMNTVDAIVALTGEDEKMLRKLGAKVQIYIAPIGVDMERYKVLPTLKEQIIFHLGAMDWLPNQEGIDWFLQEVWPDIEKEFPNSTFRFAGKRMPERFMKYASDRVKVEEFVPDAAAYMSAGRMMVVPLFSGSGMRVKIIEGMALGKAIITTPIGAEGIAAKNGEEIMLASTAEEFKKAIRNCLQNPTLVDEMGKKARLFAEVHFANREIGKKVLDFYAGLKRLNH